MTLNNQNNSYRYTPVKINLEENLLNNSYRDTGCYSFKNYVPTESKHQLREGETLGDGASGVSAMPGSGSALNGRAEPVSCRFNAPKRKLSRNFWASRAFCVVGFSHSEEGAFPEFQAQYSPLSCLSGRANYLDLL